MSYNEAEARYALMDPIFQHKGHADCARFEARYVFSINGHRYAKLNKFTGERFLALYPYLMPHH